VITRLWFGTRRDGLDLPAFSAHWHDVHGPFGLAIPGLRAYVQNHLLPDPSPLSPPWFDGCSELDFTDVPAMVAAFASPELAAADADERAFADPDRFGVVVTVRRHLAGEASRDTPARLLVVVGPPEDGATEAARRASAALLADHAIDVGAIRAELLVAVDGAPEAQAADHVQSLWFPDVAALRAAAGDWTARIARVDALQRLDRWPALVGPRRMR